MVESASTRGRIFISYRREETAYPAGWLFDRLTDRYGAGAVFKDIDSIEPGDDFVDVVTRAVGSCDVLLALIGTQWLTVTEESGGRRIDSPGDYVRLEVEAALSRKVRVVPVLVGGASMPSAEDLPASLAALSRRHALELSPSNFEFETSRLLRVIDETLDPRHDEQTEVGKPADSRVKTASARNRLSSRRSRVIAASAGVVVLGVILAVALLARSSSEASKGTLFHDDFSTRANGWDDTGQLRDGGHYVRGSYRLYTHWTKDHWSDVGNPRLAAQVFPQAPRDVTVAVTAQRLFGADQDAGYGITCRSTPNGDRSYQFAIWRDNAVIAKITPAPPYYRVLNSSEDLSAVRPGGKNRLQAICSTDASGAPSLVFMVNGHVLVPRTLDTKSPLTTGTVGLMVATGRAGAKAIEAEFDDFDVRSSDVASEQ